LTTTNNKDVKKMKIMKKETRRNCLHPDMSSPCTKEITTLLLF